MLKEYYENKFKSNDQFVLDKYNYFGSNSKCVIGSIDSGSYSPRCQRVFCDVERKNLIIYVNDDYVICAKNETNMEKTLYVYESEINFKCPHYSRVCYLNDTDILYENDFLNSIFIEHKHIMLIILILLI